MLASSTSVPDFPHNAQAWSAWLICVKKELDDVMTSCQSKQDETPPHFFDPWAVFDNCDFVANVDVQFDQELQVLDQWHLASQGLR